MLDNGLNFPLEPDYAHHDPRNQISTEYANQSPPGTSILNILEQSFLPYSLLVFGGQDGLHYIVSCFEV